MTIVSDAMIVNTIIIVIDDSRDINYDTKLSIMIVTELTLQLYVGSVYFHSIGHK